MREFFELYNPLVQFLVFTILMIWTCYNIGHLNGRIDEVKYNAKDHEAMQGKLDAVRAQNDDLQMACNRAAKNIQDCIGVKKALIATRGALAEATKEFDECAFHFETLGNGKFTNVVAGIKESVERWKSILLHAGKEL